MDRRLRILAFVFLAFAGWLGFVVWSRTSAPEPPQRTPETPDAGEVDAATTPTPELVDAFVRVTPNRRAEVDAAREADPREIAVVYATWSPGVRHGLCNVPLAGVGRDDFAARLSESLEGCAEAQGVFIPRSLGLGIRRVDRSLLQIDDEALDPIFELGKPIVIESGGPSAWFEGEGSFAGEAEEGLAWPTLNALRASVARRAARHPQVPMLLVDWGYLDAAALTRWVDAPHRYVIASGPPPEGADAVVRAHADRFLFGSGLTLTPDAARRGPEGLPIENTGEAWTAALAELEPLLDDSSRQPVLAGNALQVFGL